MRKCLLLVALLICAQWTDLAAQSLFDIPSDTVCVRQKIQLKSNVNASSYYWGFCSGYLQNPAVLTNLGSGFSLDQPTAMEIAKDGNTYYGFVLNSGTGELIRLNYGNSLSNTPQITNLGNLDNNIPARPNKLYLMKDLNGMWFMFITGGTGTSSSLTRVDFTGSLNNIPNSVSFGNLGSLLNTPTGIFVAADGSNYYGYVANAGDNKLLRLSFTTNISLTPTITDLGNPGAAFGGPSDMAGVFDNGLWYLFVTNETTNDLVRIDVGNTLANNPAAVPVGSLGGTLFNPSSITIVRDCDLTQAYITNRTSNSLVKVSMPNFTGAYTATPILPPAGTFSSPADITRVIREKDNLYAFVVNTANNTMSQVKFAQCTNSSIASSTVHTPDAYVYDQPGLYNVYLAVNEGLPDARVQCAQIRVLPIPGINRSNDTTICQGDTIKLGVLSANVIQYTWTPDYNIIPTTGKDVRVFPEYSLPYYINIAYLNGCIVDTFITVTVHKNKADAGPDRTISDGSSVLIGGPLTTTGPQYTYTWTPDQYMENAYMPVTRVNPSRDIAYFLTVRDTHGCIDVDTVVVKVECNDLNLPNAFAPESRNGSANTFGLMNRQIVQLNYFRIFDRWGKEVFKTTDVTKRWDGKINGEPAAVGVYVWEADGFCTDQHRFTKSGNVTLIR